MTVSTHEYTAYLVGSPNRDLSVRGGRITLDESNAPHVEATLTIPLPGEFTQTTHTDHLSGGYGADGYGASGYGGMAFGLEWEPDNELLALLDTRLSPPPRVVITATATAGSTTSRSFNLTLRSREVSHAQGTVTLSLASDEALLNDYAPLSNVDLYDRAGDLKALVAHVIEIALGSSVSVSGPTADLTPYWDATNLVRNPSFEVDLSLWGWTNASTSRVNDWGASNPYSMRIDSSGSVDSFAYPDGDAGGIRVGMSAGRTYTAQAEFHIGGSALGGTAGPRARRLVAFVKAPSLGPGYVEYASEPIPNTPNTRKRLGVTFDLPNDATEAFIRVYNGHTSGSIWVDAVSLTSDSRHTTYFDGSVPATTGYTYFWTGTAHQSTSQRHALIDSPDPDAFLWKAGQSALDFLTPLLQVAALRLVCDETRAWSTRDETYSAPGALNIRYAVNLIDGNDKVSRDDANWFDAAVTTYKWTDSYGTELTRTDSYAVPGYTRLRTFERTTAYAGQGFSEYAVRRAQGRGREVSAVAVSDWTAQAEQPVSITLDGAPIQTGKTSRIEFDLDRDEMTIRTRTTDTPANAIDLLPGTIDALPGTIDSLS